MRQTPVHTTGGRAGGRKPSWELWLSPNNAQRIGSDRIGSDRIGSDRIGSGRSGAGKARATCCTAQHGKAEAKATHYNATRRERQLAALTRPTANRRALRIDEDIGEDIGEDIPCDVQRRTQRSKPPLIALKKLNEIQTLKYVNRSG